MKKTYWLQTGLCFMLLIFSSFETNQNNNWVKKAYYGGGAVCGAVSFSIGNNAYVCAGTTAISNGTYRKTLYRYDPINDVWKRMADLPSTAKYRTGAIGFSINGKGYITGGYYTSLYKSYYPIDTWEYNPSNNLWFQRADFPRDGGMWMGISFAIDSIGYAGLGDSNFTQLGVPYGEMSDFYSFNPRTNKWTQLNDFPGAPRSDAFGFSMNGKGYVGLGYRYDLGNGYTFFNDFWEYDPVTDDWTRLPDFPGEGRTSPIGYGVEGNCYIGLGSINDFYKYNIVKKEWSALNYLPGSVRHRPVSFCVNANIYYGCGDLNSYTESDIWQYAIPSVSSSVEPINMDSHIVFPNPASDIIYITGNNTNYNVKIFDSKGITRLDVVSVNNEPINISQLTPGLYIVNIITVQEGKRCMLLKF